VNVKHNPVQKGGGREGRVRWTIIKFEEKTSATAYRHPQSLFRERGKETPPPPAKAGVRKNNYSYGNNPKKDQEGRKKGEDGGRLRITSKRNEFSLFLHHYHSFFVSRQANCLSRSPACLRGRKDIIGGGKGNSVVTRGQSKKRAGTKLRTMGEKENKR